MVDVFKSQALLSDSILAWRVYVIWHQPTWLWYFLGGALTVDCGKKFLDIAVTYYFLRSRWVALGLATAIWLSMSSDDGIDLFAFYQAWAWVAFLVNSTFSIGILVRIRYV